jgi:hypothetical protein
MSDMSILFGGKTIHGLLKAFLGQVKSRSPRNIRADRAKSSNRRLVALEQRGAYTD